MKSLQPIVRNQMVSLKGLISLLRTCPKLHSLMLQLTCGPKPIARLSTYEIDNNILLYQGRLHMRLSTTNNH